MGKVSENNYYIFDDYEEFIDWFESVFDFCFWYKGIEYYAGYYTKSKKNGREKGCYFSNMEDEPLHYEETFEKLFNAPFFDGNSFKELITEIEVVC